ncbi:protein kinase [Tersicoccus sp. MR15.9]|uniref:serine/threonine-protein kinase n=1 Tax=Tersicoccus mangrovi TaxID=3121635 RepID=UPI002FE5D23E
MSTRRAAPPPEIPGFRYLNVLGSGGFSDVYLYEQERPRRRVAIKVQLADLRTADARAAFEREADLMAQVSTHPYIVTIYEADVTEAGHSYLAMEYCSRPSLNVRARQSPLAVSDVLAIGVQVASAVETAHRAGIVHRDIKPANILVTDYNRPALTDFGISGTMDAAAETDAGMSIPWSPPEAFDGGATDGVRLDVWGLAATLYTLLAGRSPFSVTGGDNGQAEVIRRITSTPLPPIGREDVPGSLERVLATAMAKDPHSRYPSAKALAYDLQRIQAELALAVTPFEVLAEPASGWAETGDGEATRVRGVVSIDPDGTTNARTTDVAGPERVEVRRRPATPPAPAFGPGTGTQTHFGGVVGTPDDEHTIAGPGARPGPDSEAGTDRRRADRRGATDVPGGDETRTAEAGAASTAARTTAAGPVISRVPGVIAGTATDAGPSTEPGTGLTDRPEIAAPAAPRSRRGRLLALAVLAFAIVVAGVVVIVSLTSGPAPTATTRSAPALSPSPADPLIYGTVPTPAGLKGVPGTGGIVFTWRNPQPLAGDSYMVRKYTATDFSADPVRVASARVVVPRPAKGQTCLEVSIRRQSGRGSETPARACWSP